jgi:hypothetical protein
MDSSNMVLTLLDPRGTLNPLFCGPDYDIIQASAAQKPRRYEDLMPMPRMFGIPQIVDRWCPDWRWREARLAKGRTVRSHRGGDPKVYRDIVPYLVAKDQHPTGGYDATIDLTARWPELAWCANHWLADDQIRFYLEAMILADAPRDLLANILGVEVAHIVWFEDVFWDVRRHLGNTQRISLAVLQPARDRALTNQSHRDTMWKLLVSLCGFDYKEFMQYTHPFREIPEELQDRVRRIVAQNNWLQAVLLSIGRTPNRYTDESVHTALAVTEKARADRKAGEGAKSDGLLATKEFQEAKDSLGMAKLDLKFTGVEPNDYMDVATAFNNRVRSGQYLQFEKPALVGAAHDD